MSDLVRELDLLRDEIELPPTPELAAAVRRRIEVPRRRRARPPRRLALALVAALVLLAALMAAVPSARNGVLDFFGLRGATVEVRPELPARTPAPDPDLGERMSLEEARRAADFELLVPAELGPPGAVHVEGSEVTLSYRDGRLLVTQFRGDLHPDYVGKIVEQASTIERFPGGVWIEGSAHFFFYRAPDGGVREGSLRLAGSVLLIERGALLVRIEGAPSKQRALEIAGWLR